MATVNDGTNPGRSPQPARQSPGRTRHGRAEAGLDPTNELGQVPGEIFGFSQTYATGARGSSGSGSVPADVTIQKGQLDSGLSNVDGSEITSTGAPGSTGASNHGGGETVTYTDFFGYMGQEHRESSTTGRIDGDGDWTQFGEGSGFSGPTLPILQNARPTSTGAGQGHVRGAGRGV
ncbi:MAG TPA: hypothetical protein VGG75_38520 [Trebonia sp.]|jgi:hypothetical protein